MRIISVRALREFWERDRRAEEALRSWSKLVKDARWRHSQDVKATFNSADPIGSERVVFDISGNTYRLVARIDYKYGLLFVRFIGTHAQYDRLDARKI